MAKVLESKISGDGCVKAKRNYWIEDRESGPREVQKRAEKRDAHAPQNSVALRNLLPVDGLFFSNSVYVCW